MRIWNQWWYRQNFLMQTLSQTDVDVQGNLSRKLNHDQSLLCTLSPVSIPFRERKWIDINPGTYSQGCSEVSNFMIRLFRHDESVFGEDDGAVRLTTWQKISRRNTMVLRNGQLTLRLLSWQKAVYWCTLKLAQRKGLQFFQTRSHAIALFNTLPAVCIEKWYA